MTETERIRDLLDRAVDGDAWHGPSLSALLATVPPELAALGRSPAPTRSGSWCSTPAPGRRSSAVGWPANRGPQHPATVDWPPVGAAGRDGWREAVEQLEASHRRLADAVAATPDDRLDDLVAGGDHTVYVMLHGLIHHHLYHAGQIALLKRAAGVAPV